MNKFKSTPGGKKIFKKRFPNPLVKIAQGIGNYVKQGGALGILANALGGGKKAATGFGKDASTMAKDLAGMFGLDSLKSKLINIAGGKDTNDFNKVVKNNAASTRMRNNLVYGDPLGLNNKPFYEDTILRNLQNQERMLNNQVRQNTLDSYGTPNPAFGTDQFDPVAYNDMVLQDQFQKENEARRNAFGDDKEAIEQSLTPGEINLSTINDLVNLRTNDEDIFEDVSVTDYSAPNIEGTNPRGEVSSARSTPLIGGDPNVPYGYEENILDVLAENSRATGGYMSSFPNQNLNTESLSASDNIDDRIMKNLQFEKMSPGMMGYNQGGKVMSTYDKLNAIADNNYG